MTYSKYQSVQTMETTGSGDDTSIKLPAALHLVENSDGQRRYTLQSSIDAGRETEAYTIIETIHLVSESQQLSMASKKSKPILISLKELKGMTGQEDPPILSSIDPFDNAMEQPQNPPIPEFIFYIYDHLGNTRVTYSTTHDGSAVVYTMEGAVDYFPYGKVLREYHNGEVEKYLSTQHERDQETGLDYRGARFYDADVGRFLSLDPLAADFAEWSAYNYVLGNPLNYIDPDGRAAKWVPEYDAENQKIKLKREEGDNLSSLKEWANGSIPDHQLGTLYNKMEDGKIDLTTTSAGDFALGFIANEQGCNFNCFSSISSTGEETETRYENAKERDFTSLVESKGMTESAVTLGSLENAQPFKSYFGYSMPGNTKDLDHVSIYAGKDKGGNIYVLTKNGYKTMNEDGSLGGGNDMEFQKGSEYYGEKPDKIYNLL